MADSFSQIRTRVRRYLIETDASTSFWSDNFVNQLFNAAYHRRCSQLVMAYEGWFVSVATRELTADKARYAFPNGTQKIQKLELVRSDGRTVPLEYNNRHSDINPAADQSSTGDQYLPTWRAVSNSFILEPTPKQTVVGGLRIEYVGLPTKLSADTDEIHPSFPDIFEELLVLDTVVACFDAESAQESGMIRSLLRLRKEFETDFDRFIDQRIVARASTEPWIPHYSDA